ncbi:MAG: HDOD domain-containing protein, partial [Chromatiales bacterium]|nr:HDOD domain-containing protein [Chromatiales bacterium]
MGEALAETVKRLAQLPLPALKENLQRIRQLASSDGSDMGEIADIVESDLGLSVLLLGHLNTSRHRQNRHPVTNARHALMMMGLEPLRQLLPRVVVAEEQCDEGVQQQLRGLYCRAFHAAHQAIAIARARNDYDEEELASAAQLAHIGRAMRMVHEGS